MLRLSDNNRSSEIAYWQEALQFINSYRNCAKFRDGSKLSIMANHLLAKHQATNIRGVVSLFTPSDTKYCMAKNNAASISNAIFRMEIYVTFYIFSCRAKI